MNRRCVQRLLGETRTPGLQPTPKVLFRVGKRSTIKSARVSATPSPLLGADNLYESEAMSPGTIQATRECQALKMTLQSNNDELNSAFNSMAHFTAFSKIVDALTAASTVCEVISNLNGTFQKSPTVDKDTKNYQHNKYMQ